MITSFLLPFIIGALALGFLIMCILALSKARPQELIIIAFIAFGVFISWAAGKVILFLLGVNP